MPTTKYQLKVFLYYTKDDLPVVRSLYERLVLDGLNVNLSEFAVIEMHVETFENSPYWRETKNEVKGFMRDADVVLFCLSNRFNEQASLSNEWQFILDAAAEKHGTSSILPVRLEECDVPQLMTRWLSIDLFENDGYEKLMLAIKLRADRMFSTLAPNESWKESFYEPAVQEKYSEPKNSLPTLVMVAVLVIVGIVVMSYFRATGVRSANETSDPVDVLVERVTQNAISLGTEKAAKATAEAFAFNDPLTQKAAQRTAEPLAQTATAYAARITPTITVTPVSLPAQIVAVENVSMVLIPAGTFVMGSDGYGTASPSGTIYLESFYIDQYEVTNILYQTCVTAGACQPPKRIASQTHAQYYGASEFAGYPVINVDWYMAQKFCEWRSARLPSEAEWEKAARGPDALIHPWGDESGCQYANYSASGNYCIGDAQSVEKYASGKSVYNAYNMAGNVSEWVASLYLPYPYNSFDERDETDATGLRTVRGGSWASSPEEILAYHRISMDPSAVSVYANDLGFRCASDANQ